MTKFKSLSGETHLLIKYVIKFLGLACLRVSNFISKHKFKIQNTLNALAGSTINEVYGEFLGYKN